MGLLEGMSRFEERGKDYPELNEVFRLAKQHHISIGVMHSNELENNVRKVSTIGSLSLSLGGIYQACFGGVSRSVAFGKFLKRMNHLRQEEHKSPLNVYPGSMAGSRIDQATQRLHHSRIGGSGGLMIEVYPGKLMEIHTIFFHINVYDEGQVRAVEDFLYEIDKLYPGEQFNKLSLILSLDYID